MEAFEFLRNVTALIRIAHHVPGRVRLKLNTGAEIARFARLGHETGRFTGALGTLPGIRRIHLNKLARSVTVEYDNNLIADRAWPDLLANQPTPEAMALLNHLQNHYHQATET